MIQTFWPGPGNDKDAGWMADMLVDGDHADGTNYVQNFKSQVRTKSMLLQRVAAAVGYEPALGDQFVTHRVPSADIIPSRIQVILKATSRWPRILNDIKNHVLEAKATRQAFGLSVPPHPYSGAQAAHFREVHMLLGARTNLRKSTYFVAEANLQLTAFMLHWHSTVSLLTLRQAYLNSPWAPPSAEYSFPAGQHHFLPASARGVPRAPER